jgi:hypothetical protein
MEKRGLYILERDIGRNSKIFLGLDGTEKAVTNYLRMNHPSGEVRSRPATGEMFEMYCLTEKKIIVL